MGLVFTYAGFSKVLEPVENFSGLLAENTILPYFIIPAIARILPWVEIVSGIFLILGFMPRLSALTLAIISAGFVATLAAGRLVLGYYPDSCGCFGEGGIIHLTTQQVMLLDLFDFIIGIELFLLKDHAWSLDKWMKKSS